MKETGACLHFTVKDYDKFSNDDIAGHAFFNLNNVMGLHENINVAGGFESVPQQTLNIFHPKPEGQYFESKTPPFCCCMHVIVFFWLFFVLLK